MQKPKINSNKESGMAMIMTLLAVLALSLIAAALLKSQLVMMKSQNQIFSAEAGTDSTDFCVQGALDYLKTMSANNTLPLSNPISAFSATSTYVINRKSLAYATSAGSVANARYTSSNTTPTSCTLTFIKQDVTSSTGSSGVEISASRVYGSMSSVPVTYYRLISIKDDSNIRVEYQTILAI